MMTTMISAALTSGSDTSSEITDAHFQTVLVGKYAFQDDNIDRLTQGSEMDGAMDQMDISSVDSPEEPRPGMAVLTSVTQTMSRSFTRSLTTVRRRMSGCNLQ